jgi:hypothetical protein
MRTRKDINQTNPDGQHPDPTVSLINAVVTTCQGELLDHVLLSML